APCANDPDLHAWIGPGPEPGVTDEMRGVQRTNACGCPPTAREPSWDRSCGIASLAFSMAGSVARVSFWGVAGKATPLTPKHSGRPRAEPRLAVWHSRGAVAACGNRTVQRRAVVVNRSARQA